MTSIKAACAGMAVSIAVAAAFAWTRDAQFVREALAGEQQRAAVAPNQLPAGIDGTYWCRNYGTHYVYRDRTEGKDLTGIASPDGSYAVFLHRPGKMFDGWCFGLKLGRNRRGEDAYALIQTNGPWAAPTAWSNLP